MTGPLGATDREWRDRLAASGRRHGVTGAQLGIVRLDAGGRPSEHVVVCSGQAEVRSSTPVTRDTLFEIGSITKMWTAILLMQLVGEGRVSLGTRVCEIIPEFTLQDPAAAAMVTVGALLTHTSGIEGDVFTDTGEGAEAVERYVAALRSARTLHPAGARFSYCNAGFVVAGRIVERLEGARFGDVLRERIITPLGLSHTIPNRGDAGRFSVAVGREGRLPSALAPAGLILSNADDMLAFARMLLCDGAAGPHRDILDAPSVSAMRRRRVDLRSLHPTAAGWGLGTMLENWGSTTAWGHDGATIGQRAYLRILPAHRVAAVLLTVGGQADGLFGDVVGDVAASCGVSMPPAMVATGRLHMADEAAYGFDDVGAIVWGDRGGAQLTVIEPSETGGHPRRSTHELHASSAPDLWAWTTPELRGWAPFRPVDGGAYLGLRYLPERMPSL